MATQARRFDAEPPLVRDRNLWAGVRLWTGAMAFLFVTFVFAFLYLRELNNNHMWRDKHANPPLAFGSVILVCVIVGVAVYGLAVRSLPARGESGWRRLAILAVALLAAAFVVQCFEWARPGFGPKDGGWASVFYGWTVFYALALLGGIYWLWTQVAQSLRGPDPTRDGGAGTNLADIEAVAYFLYFLAIVEIVLFLLLYLVA